LYLQVLEDVIQLLHNDQIFHSDMMLLMPDIDANVAKSVAVVGKNMSALACDYICFVEYERSFQCDILQGTVVE